jgi:hypothetical protein
MSKQSKAKARLRKGRFAKPSPPRRIGLGTEANDNHANDNTSPVTIRGVRLTENQAYRYHIAVRNRAHSSIEIQRAGHVALEALNREIDAIVSAREAKAGLDERIGLEALRGVRIEPSKVEGAAGVPRLHTDGLETMLSAGAITTTQHAAGLRYRADYETLDPEGGLTPPQLDPEKIKSAHGGEGWDDKRREIEERVFRVHLMICGIDNKPGERGAIPNLPKGHPAMRAIYALDEVAGKGRIISYMSESGSVRARIRDDLTFALDTCEIVYGLG